MTIIMLNFSSSMQTQLMFDRMEELRQKVRLHCSHPPNFASINCYIYGSRNSLCKLLTLPLTLWGSVTIKSKRMFNAIDMVVKDLLKLWWTENRITVTKFDHLSYHAGTRAWRGKQTAQDQGILLSRPCTYIQVTWNVIQIVYDGNAWKLFIVFIQGGD